jgi:hypothetical protein
MCFLEQSAEDREQRSNTPLHAGVLENVAAEDGAGFGDGLGCRRNNHHLIVGKTPW